MKIGCIGHGFVGGALDKSFTSRGVSVSIFDKYKKIGSVDDILECDAIFLCLPTPFVNGHGFDIGALIENLRQLSKKNYSGLVIIKSTIEPGTCDTLALQYNLKIIHNPEFLTARTAFEDFDSQKHIVLGYTKYSKEHVSHIESFFMKLYPDAEVSICTSKESESMKIFCNNFYAVKVQVFNEFYLLCQKIGADFETVKELMLKNGWINEMHTNVPGPDGKVSYGGECFTKDTSALRHFMNVSGTPNAIIDAAITERNKMRKD